MAEYSNLSATINAQIRANGVQAITGPVLNAVLTAMVNVLGDGYRLNGVAVPADNPGSPDNRVAYLAAQDGTYTNFGGLTISGEVALLLWDSAWTKEVLFSIDTAVTPGSGHLVTSGAVDDALTTLAGNIAAAYMQLVPAATEDNLASYDGAGQVKDSGIAAADVVKKDGVYPDLFAGFAGNLVDTRSAGTRQSFAFRQSGGDGVNYMRKILGRTEAWNQLVENGNFATASGWDSSNASLTFDTNCAKMTASAKYGGIRTRNRLDVIAGHTYLISFDISTSVEYGHLRADWGSITIEVIGTGTGRRRGVVTFTAPSSGSEFFWIHDYNDSNFQEVTIYNAFVVDLTLEGLGLTTADQFRALHPLPYYDYNAGVLKNNAATGIKTRGFNQWDEEWIEDQSRVKTKNYIPVIAGQTFYLKVGDLTNSYPFTAYYFDEEKNAVTNIYPYAASTITIPSGVAYMKILFPVAYGATYNHDICINLSDASRNGTYEPYWERTLALGLNSIPCHDENNNAVVVNGLDGVGTAQDEVVVENGWGTKINKKMEEVDLGSLTWVLAEDSLYRINLSNVISKPETNWNVGNIICAKYVTNSRNGMPDKTIAVSADGNVFVKDSAFSGYTGAQVAAALTGVKLRYELATSKVLTLDNPIPALIEVDNLGTEKRLPEDTADNPQGGFECDSNYSVSTANLVRLLNL